MRNLLLLLLVSTFVSCGGVVGLLTTLSFTNSINKNYNNHFVLLRAKGKNGNPDYSVFKDYGSTNSGGKTYAINVYVYRQTGLSAQEFFDKNVGTDLVVEIVDVGDHTEYETPDTPISVPDYYGENGKIFEKGNSQSKDLEKIASNIEGKDASELALEIESKYGLTSERSQKVATLQLAYNKLKSKRALSAKDQDIFTKNLVGVDFQTAQKALKNHIQGDSTDMENVLEKAAELNQTSPEHMVEILGDLLL